MIKRCAVIACTADDIKKLHFRLNMTSVHDNKVGEMRKSVVLILKTDTWTVIGLKRTIIDTDFFKKQFCVLIHESTSIRFMSGHENAYTSYFH